MRMNDLGGWSVTPPSCATSVIILKELSKANDNELKASSGTIADPDMGTYNLMPRPIGTYDTLITQVTIRFSLVPIRT